MSEPTYAFDPDTTPGWQEAVGQTHVHEQDFPVGEAPGEVLTSADGERVEIPPHLDGTPVKLSTGQEA